MLEQAIAIGLFEARTKWTPKQTASNRKLGKVIRGKGIKGKFAVARLNANKELVKRLDNQGLEHNAALVSKKRVPESKESSLYIRQRYGNSPSKVVDKRSKLKKTLSYMLK